ncbi:MAG: protein translocase subunit SecF [Synechococcaceae cyanobacterium SM2_3_60]|nr:protein translocase subunit SecF [Synechococcaceae cyanobacterium SM2_3_60]
MFNIVGRQRLWLSISGGAIIAGLVAMVVSWATVGSPLRLGLDFTGGTLLQLHFADTVTVDAPTLRQALAAEGVTAVVQLDGSDSQVALVRMPPLSETDRLAIEAELRETIGEFRRDRVETGRANHWGGFWLRTGLLAVLVTFGLIVVYVGFRFQFDYAIFAIVALLHDIVITTGIFALLGLTLGIEVDSLFLVALLTILGFSVNDTVVIYDRIRENSRKLLSRKVTFADVVNISINQTIMRSVNTSLTTMLALVAIVVFGGATLRYFALTLLIGFAWGTYSSIFIAGILLAWWRQRQQPTAPALPEEAEPAA